MATALTVDAVERSTYVITLSFTDEDGEDEIPTSITWTLTDADGAVINELEDEVVGTPAAEVEIVLSGADLQVGAASVTRVFTVEAVYDSDLGAGLPLTGSATFTVEALAAVP